MILKKKYKIWLASPHLSEKGYELKWIEKALIDNWVAPLGPNVDLFEDELAKYTNSKFVHVVNSGTSAIHLALKSLGVGAGDLVICPNFTFAATAFPILYLGAEPIFVDSNFDTWNIDPILLEQAIKENIGKIKALVVVHIYGLLCDMEPILKLAKKYGIPIVEDAAEALGSTYYNDYAGTLTEIGTLSFNGNKIITTSSGGAILTNESYLDSRVRHISNQSRDKVDYYFHSEIGFNYRMSNILAGIGLGQLEILEERIQKKREIYKYYSNNLKHLSGIRLMPLLEGSKPNYWLTTILTNTSNTRDRIIENMEKIRIQVRRAWTPLDTMPVFSGYKSYSQNISNQLFELGLSLPSDTSITESELFEVIKVIIDSWVS
jgi:dTDP-4-amino-4,6-dideoxygalactose transaminase